MEPGPFRTGLFGSHSASEPMPEYAGTVGRTRQTITCSAGTQPGDPAKAATAILTALAAPGTPLRLPLGDDAAIDPQPSTAPAPTSAPGKSSPATPESPTERFPMSTLRLGVSLQPRGHVPRNAALRAASHAEDLGFDHVAVGNRLLDSGFGLDADPLVLLSAMSAVRGGRGCLPPCSSRPRSGARARQPGGHPRRHLRRPPHPRRRHRLEPGRVRRAGCQKPGTRRPHRRPPRGRGPCGHRPADFDGPFTTLRGVRLGVPPSPRRARRFGSAATVTPPCAARCASEMAGTGPASAPPNSPTCDAACMNSTRARGRRSASRSPRRPS